MLPIFKQNISQQDIYQGWVKKCYNYFSKCKDSDFFSEKMQHFYFYSDVNPESVENLMRELRNASKTTVDEGGVQISPKPIVLHLNSPGGYVSAMNIFDVMMKIQRVPFCVIIENETASAATMIALMAPYRLMIDNSLYLIHDMAGMSSGKEGNKIIQNQQYIYQWLSNYIPLVKNRTKLSDDEINNFIERDIYLDANYCKKKGIIDRILKFPKINTPNKFNNKNMFSNLQLSLTSFLKKTNLNHMFIDASKIHVYSHILSQIDLNISDIRSLDDICIAIDKYFLNKKNDENNKKQLVLHFLPYEGRYSSPFGVISLCYRLALLQKKIPIIAFIEGYQTLEQLALIMMCPIRVMIVPSIISSYFTFNNTEFGWKTIDVIENTKLTMKMTKRFFRTHTKLPAKFYTDLEKRIITLSPDDSLKYELVHHVLKINKKRITIKDIIKYFKLNSITDLYTKKVRKKKVKKKIRVIRKEKKTRNRDR